MSGAEGHRLAGLDYSVVQQCIHCGMCLPDCPTYRETGQERNSPRGRIAWMRAIADGEIEVNRAFADEMYYCLGCLACQSACPADVDYAQLLEAARAEVEEAGILEDRRQRSFWRWLALRAIFTRPRLLRGIGRGIRVYQRTGLDRAVRRSGLLRVLPGRLAALEPQTPRIERRFSPQRIPARLLPGGEKPRYRVALLTGCVQDLAFSSVNRATAEVLLANGCEVITPPVQPCCGSLHAHNGAIGLARDLARRQIDLFPPGDFDAIVSNAGGCGSHLRRYGELLADDPAYAARAAEWDRKLRDVHEWLVEIGCRAPRMAPAPGGRPLRLTYHPSCHLHHGQRIRRQPEQLLDLLPGTERVPLAEATSCCGSAGIYNITQPEQAAKLQAAKIKHLRATGAEIVATANPGCHLQLVNGFPPGESAPRVTHPVVLLAEAYARER